MNKNQCMGCQAGWKLKQVPRWGALTMPYFREIHFAPDGGVVSCTRDLYNTCDSLIMSVSGDPCRNPAEPGQLCVFCQEFKQMCELADAACQGCGHPEEDHNEHGCDHGAHEVEGYIAPYEYFPCKCRKHATL